jgi:hypothetical protein
MSREISPVLSESFEDVLNAVQETARGRWFLQEYASRKKSEDTASILAAIVKLESVMARVPAAQQAAEPALLEIAKAAIARAKAQIRELAPKDSPLSHEAQLFARLAELSRSTFAEGGDADAETRQALGRSMEVALRLVNELDSRFGEGSAKSTTGQKYFNQDAEIFESAAAKSAASITAVDLQTEQVKPAEDPIRKPTNLPDLTSTGDALTTQALEPVPRGAKLTISRHPQEMTSAPEPVAGIDTMNIKALTQPGAEPPPAIVSEDVQPARREPISSEPRIVIVRRRPDEAIDVPLYDKKDTAA